MLLAHLADSHLGYRQYYRQTSAGQNQREADVAHAFRGVVDDLLGCRPDAIIMAGDLFHTVRPPNAAIVFAFRELQRLRAGLPDAPIILIAGNHDTPRSAETGSILRLFAELGLDVVADQPRRLVYPHLDLSVLGVPHQSLMDPVRPALEPQGSEARQVLALHGEIAGTFPSDAVEYGGAVLEAGELHAAEWSYVALGHYHVMHQVADRVWYSGALDYVSTNPWGERRDEEERHVRGKGWLLVDPDRGTVEPHWVKAARRVIDLPPIDATDRSPAELDRILQEQVDSIPGGYPDHIVRQVVVSIPRHIARELDHAYVRMVKASALHFRLDLRRPETERGVGVGPAGRRQPLRELLGDYLRGRPLPAELDRERFVAAGVALLDEVERTGAGMPGDETA